MHRLTLILVLFLIPSPLAATMLESGPQQAVLLELYTSEGCSSCPPADRWLSGLQNDDRLWNTIVPVAFHVDYWDRLGWADRFAEPEYGDRQRALANEWGSSTVYTPGFVVNGNEWRAWFNNRDLALEPETVGTLSVELSGGTAVGTFVPESPIAEPVTLNVAITRSGIESKVTAGENNGKRLVHDFVVTQHSSVRMTKDGTAWTARLTGLRIGRDSGSVAAWVTVGGSLKPVQAAGGSLHD